MIKGLAVWFGSNPSRTRNTTLASNDQLVDRPRRSYSHNVCFNEKLTTRNNVTSRASSVMPALPVMAVVFLSFIIIGMALPVLPLHVHNVLGFGPLVVGVVAGGQFAAALISRLWAGRLSDSRGAKYAVAFGLIASVIGGVFYIASLQVLEMKV